jgi:hypothetical protein
MVMPPLRALKAGFIIAHNSRHRIPNVMLGSNTYIIPPHEIPEALIYGIVTHT